MIRNKTSFLTAGSNGGIDDEYYVDEIIGIEINPRFGGVNPAPISP